MKISIEFLKTLIAKKKYIWFEDKPNIIAIRTALQVPDVFNDVFCIVYKENGIEKLYTATITTEPGVFYQKNLLNKKGCWVMMPAQMIDAFSLGFHQGKADHECLRSTGMIYGLREDDKDGIILNDKDAVATWVDGTTVGANVHGANKKTDLTTIVGQNSAGCQVHNRWSKKTEMVSICKAYKVYCKNKFTYTLIEEKDL